MSEPSALLRRITDLERKLEALEDRERKSGAQAWNARHQGVFLNVMLDDVVLPALLMVAGQGGKAFLLDALQGVIDRIPDHPGIPPEVERYYGANVRGWQNAVREIPSWRPLSADARHPHDPDEP